MTASTILAGDVGGTKIHLGLYRADGGALAMLADRQFRTREWASLEAPLTTFLQGRGKIDAACFGIPAAVIDGVGRPVNIPWAMSEASIAQLLAGTPTRLLNDLEATAWGTLRLEAGELATLQSGRSPSRSANVVVIAAGTGLGEAGMVRTSAGWHVIASEGGHADFAPRGGEQELLLKFLEQEFGHVSFERLVSGPGLHNIYRFLLSRGGEPEPEWLATRMRAEDPSAVIGEAGIKDQEPRCVRALEIFAAIYGAEAAHLALKYLALGGVYVCGGIAPKILPILRGGGFIRAFLDKGRLRSTLEQIPVRVSLNENTALIGAAHFAAGMV
ncbi:MAG TPA: glucokinase [Candidatus Binataceae bacterium]|nr:glucokinase [Candidatus Binataceae bacterium]